MTELHRIAIAVLILAARAGAAEIRVAAVAGTEGLSEFHIAVRDHFHVEGSAIAVCRSRHIPDEHLPVAFLIAARAHAAPAAIVDMRLGGRSWMEICLHFGLSPEVFFVETVRPWGPPYGRALGHFKGRPRAQWGALRLPDDDIVLLANVKFLSAHHGVPADDVLEMHAKHGDHVKALAQIKLAKASGPGAKDAGKASRPEAKDSPAEKRSGGSDREKGSVRRDREKGAPAGRMHGGGGGGKGRKR